MTKTGPLVGPRNGSAVRTLLAGINNLDNLTLRHRSQLTIHMSAIDQSREVLGFKIPTPRVYVPKITNKQNWRDKAPLCRKPARRRNRVDSA